MTSVDTARDYATKSWPPTFLVAMNLPCVKVGGHEFVSHEFFAMNSFHQATHASPNRSVASWLGVVRAGIQASDYWGCLFGDRALSTLVDAPHVQT